MRVKRPGGRRGGNQATQARQVSAAVLDCVPLGMREAVVAHTDSFCA